MLFRVTYCLLGRLVSSRLLLLLFLPDGNWGSLGHTPLNRFRGVTFSVLKLAREKSEWNMVKKIEMREICIGHELPSHPSYCGMWGFPCLSNRTEGKPDAH